MTVGKDEPMDHPAAKDDEFDALLGASSLNAPHVVAESSDIPATARCRMAQALDQLRGRLDIPDSTTSPQSGEGDSHPGVPADEEEPTLTRRMQELDSHDGFTSFVRQEHLSLVRFVAALGASWEEAENAVIGVLAELLPRWDLIRNPRTYCRLAAERVWINSDVRLREVPEAVIREPWTTLAQQNVSDSYEQLERDHALRHLHLLNQEQRRVMAYFFDGYAPEEIATLLDKKPSAVRSSIRHARKQLTAALTAEQLREMSAATSRPGTQTHLGGS